MNIFKVDNDPVIAAQSLCNSHVIKMLLETAQLLSTAHRVLDKDVPEVMYKSTHQNHPSAIWCRESIENYNWLYRHFVGLCDEYTYRYKKVHKTDTKLRDVLKNAPKNIPQIPMTKFRLAMSNNPECIVVGDDVQSYRNYYKTKKDKFSMKWTIRDVPEWFL